MRKKFFSSILSVLLAVFLAGCVPMVLVAVGAGAVGGYAVSRDTFEGMSSKGQDELWDAMGHVASIMGTINESDRKKGEMIATINGARVTIDIIPVNLTTTKLRIKARKGIFPRIAVAQDVYTKIIHQLEQ
ncbi:MAG: hypothetical protein HY209_04120 [Candidatus Omnitrophica bacterium]|nr:hypothetical protein [Candidatus Omnitrophota bacterium]